MSINKSDIAKVILIDAGYDLSDNTELNIVFKKPDASTVTKASADGVTAPTTSVTVKLNGEDTTFKANEYFRYPTETGFLDAGGTWKAQGVYIEGATKNLAGDIVTFAVPERL